ncbi:MAG TPA: thioredoxin family protein [Chloroflexota bacterium]|jgi:alkyl hydroperoxide reductase subunit AhpF
MALLAQADRDTISHMFEGLVDPVRILLFTIPTSALIVPGRETCESCSDVQQLLTEVSELTDKVTLDVHQFARGSEDAQKYGIERVPTILLLGPEDGRVRYSGAPFGHEFATMLQDIIGISRGETKLTAATREAIAAISDPINIQVFVTPT